MLGLSVPFVPIQAAVHKDPMGPARFGRWLPEPRVAAQRLRSPVPADWRAQRARVPVCRRITFRAVDLRPRRTSSDITAVTRVPRPDTSASRWPHRLHHRHALSGQRRRQRCRVKSQWLWRVEVTSATLAQVYRFRLSSALRRRGNVGGGRHQLRHHHSLHATLTTQYASAGWRRASPLPAAPRAAANAGRALYGVSHSPSAGSLPPAEPSEAVPRRGTTPTAATTRGRWRATSAGGRFPHGRHVRASSAGSASTFTLSRGRSRALTVALCGAATAIGAFGPGLDAAGRHCGLERRRHRHPREDGLDDSADAVDVPVRPLATLGARSR